MNEPAVHTGHAWLADAEATARAGAAIAAHLQGGMLVTLTGELGSGKTTFVRGVLRALGWTGPVKSPTYTLVEHYTFSRLYFYHFDFFRLEDPGEWESAGFTEYFGPTSVCLAEWPERAAGYLPSADLELRLSYEPDREGRSLDLAAFTARGARCVAAALHATS